MVPPVSKPGLISALGKGLSLLVSTSRAVQTNLWCPWDCPLRCAATLAALGRDSWVEPSCWSGYGDGELRSHILLGVPSSCCHVLNSVTPAAKEVAVLPQCYPSLLAVLLELGAWVLGFPFSVCALSRDRKTPVTATSHQGVALLALAPWLKANLCLLYPLLLSPALCEPCHHRGDSGEVGNSAWGFAWH